MKPTNEQILRDALTDITNPIAAMQRDLPEGCSLNGGMAIRMADDPEHYKRIARAALAATEASESAPEDGPMIISGNGIQITGQPDGSILVTNRDAPAQQAEAPGLVYQVNQSDFAQMWMDVRQHEYEAAEFTKRIVYTHPAPSQNADQVRDARFNQVWDDALNEAALACSALIRKDADVIEMREEINNRDRFNGAVGQCIDEIRALKASPAPAAHGSAEASAPTWTRITAPGQVKVGDKLRFNIGDDKYNETVKQILEPGTDREELIYNKRKNYYVITKNAMTDFGSSKNVEFLASDRSKDACVVCGSKWGDPCKSVECSYESIGERDRLATSSAAKGVSDV